MKTLFEVYRWQVTVLALCVYLVWKNGGWVKAVYDSRPELQGFIEANCIAVVALIAAVYIGYTLYQENRPSKK